MISVGVPMPRQKKKYRSVAPAKSVVSAVAAITPRYLDIPQAAVYMSVTTWTVRRLIKNGALRAPQIGRRQIIDRLQLDDLYQQKANEKAA